MKKYLIIAIAVLMVITPIAAASNMLSTDEKVVNKQNMAKTQTYTHTVLAEYVSTTTCPYCPTASDQLYLIYNLEIYDFYYVSLVVDANSKIYSRVSELGVSGVPDVYFDGKYKNVLGAQSDEIPYIDAIVQSGSRTVPDIDLDVNVEWVMNAVLKITVTVQNNEPENYDGLLRVYVVEPDSRWNDQSGDPYHFAVLDIPIDEPLAVPHGQVRPLGDTYTFEKTWFGLLNGFGDITQDNIMVIASLFNKNSDYAVQTAAAEPTSSSSPQNYNVQYYAGLMLQELLGRLAVKFPLLNQFLQKINH